MAAENWNSIHPLSQSSSRQMHYVGVKDSFLIHCSPQESQTVPQRESKNGQRPRAARELGERSTASSEGNRLSTTPTSAWSRGERAGERAGVSAHGTGWFQLKRLWRQQARGDALQHQVGYCSRSQRALGSLLGASLK